MPYQVRYYRRAREERDFLRSTYGADFVVEFDRWQDSLVARISNGDYSSTLDAHAAFEQVSQGSTQLQANMQRFLSASARVKMRALAFLVRKRCLPWAMRMTAGWFTLLNRIKQEINVYFFVDHTKKQIIFVYFDLVDGDDEAADFPDP